MSWQRLLSGIIIFVITTLAILNQWIFIVFICGLTVGGLYEFFHMIKRKGIPIYSYVGIFIGILIPLSIFFQFELTRNWELLFIVCAFLLILLLQFGREDNRNAVVGLSTTLFGVIYVSWFFSFIVKTRLLLPGFAGAELVAFIIVITKAGDIGAMTFGSWLGKHPLLPKVSPNKSIEGCIGGIVTSSIAAVLCHVWLPNLPHFTLGFVAIMGAFFGGLGQLGDLSESLIKRDCNVKDSGHLIPGMGGILDSIDSLLFSVPAFYLYMSSTLNLFVGR
ncbi:MAG: phosphatidate cytidylyltransferase [Candidatus Omnitrophica bacterium]|nr:phosphatidate cytidylyltransferase [Candidatus Omnitrophota bacterium]